MPIDGVVTRNIVFELNQKLMNGRIDKISQPEVDEIIITIRNNGQNFKLLLSSSPNYPRVHLTEVQKPNPINAPMFCMVLRKYLSGGRIVRIEQHKLDRIIKIYIECYDELGTLSNKILFCEIMGRRSNIILVNENTGTILDSIKHLTSDMNSYRQILPGTKYIYPPSMDKLEPLDFSFDDMYKRLKENTSSVSLEKFISSNFDGISLFAAKEICYNASLYSDAPIASLDDADTKRLADSLKDFLDEVSKCNFYPCIYYEGNAMSDFYSVKLNYLRKMNIEDNKSISETIERFYHNKDKADRMRQKSSDILKIINNNLSRCYKKLSIQEEKLNECSKKDLWKLYGDLIMTNLYSIKKGDNKALLTNYFDEDQPVIEIPLDMMLSPVENAQKYYKKYNKDKTAESTVSKQKEENILEIEYLEGQLVNLSNCSEDVEIDEIRNELISLGYIKRSKNASYRKKEQSKPMHYVSSEGFDIYVGKNNLQNDFLTLKFATAQDIWMHTKKVPGSHVIIKSDGKKIGEKTLIEGANLAAYFSKAKNSSNVPVDYTERKNVKKPSGAKPGMVIYYTNKTIYVTPDEAFINSIKKAK